MSTPAAPAAGEKAPAPQSLKLTLFISGASAASALAVQRLRSLCDRHAPAGYNLEIVDIYQQPEMVVARGVLAVPTLIKDLPLPVEVMIGDFTDERRVLAALGLHLAVATEP